MQPIYKPNYKFKFSLSVRWNGAELKITKLAPILNQLGIEGSTSVDDFVNLYLLNLNWKEEQTYNFYLRLNLIIWKREAPYSYFGIMPITLDSLLKFWMDKKTDMDSNLNKTLCCKMGFLSLISWNIENGNRISLKKNLLSVSKIKGSFPSYSKRSLMLGRKFNFRKKVRGKKLIEY